MGPGDVGSNANLGCVGITLAPAACAAALVDALSAASGACRCQGPNSTIRKAAVLMTATAAVTSRGRATSFSRIFIFGPFVFAKTSRPADAGSRRLTRRKAAEHAERAQLSLVSHFSIPYDNSVRAGDRAALRPCGQSWNLPDLHLAFWLSMGLKPGNFMTAGMNEKRAAWFYRVLDRVVHPA